MVDDNRATHLVFGMVLGADYQLLKANDVAEAKAHIQAHRDAIAVILTDWNLPDGDGGDVVAEARAQCPTPPKIVVITGNPEQNGPAIQAVHPNAIRVKPLTAAELRATVSNVLIRAA